MWSFCQDSEGRRGLKAGKSTHQLGILGILGLLEEGDAAVEVSALACGEGAIEFHVTACAKQAARQRLNPVIIQ